jgi:hypothetical protein
VAQETLFTSLGPLFLFLVVPMLLSSFVVVVSRLMMVVMVGGTKEWAAAWRIENQQRHVIWA